MAAQRLLLGATFLVAATQALQLSDVPKARGSSSQFILGSQPGSPHKTTLPEGAKWPYMTHNAKREDWGDRLVASAKATATEEKCGGFVSFGDFTWCAKAMPKETEATRNPGEPYGPMLVATEGHRASLQALNSGDQYLAITMGIRERDMWSELMSNRYAVGSRLYDCFFNEERGPMYTRNLTATAMGKKACPTWRNGVCYGAEYEAKRVCVGAMDKFTPKDKSFQPLSEVLQDRAFLSTYVKMDIEGSEWDVLEKFLENEEDMDKVRTLDMEAHFMGRANEFKNDKNTEKMEKEIERQVRLMERLTQKFAVVGSTIQGTHDSLAQRVRKGWPINPLEPLVYTTNGFSVEKFTIDLVNKKLLAQL